MSLNLVIVGDEAWTPDELSARQRRRLKDRTRYHTDPQRRAKVLAAAKRWQAAHPERSRELRLAHQARRRSDPAYRARESAQSSAYRIIHRAYLVGSLHSLACSGPTKASGCRCRKVRCYDKPR